VLDDEDAAILVGGDEAWRAERGRRGGERAVDRDLALEVPGPDLVGPREPLGDRGGAVGGAGQELGLARSDAV
jgi:hypothetical protein